MRSDSSFGARATPRPETDKSNPANVFVNPTNSQPHLVLVVSRPAFGWNPSASVVFLCPTQFLLVLATAASIDRLVDSFYRALTESLLPSICSTRSHIYAYPTN